MKRSKMRRIGTVWAKVSGEIVAQLRRDGLAFGPMKHGKVRVDGGVAKLLHKHRRG